jgi:hypothetical protein
VRGKFGFGLLTVAFRPQEDIVDSAKMVTLTVTDQVVVIPRKKGYRLSKRLSNRQSTATKRGGKTP